MIASHKTGGFMLPTLGPTELIIILVIVVLIFGAGKLPELGGAVGKTMREFRSATKEVDSIKTEVKDSVSLEPDSNKEAPAKKS
jgi:sec-independent protein translocase protein TatA